MKTFPFHCLGRLIAGLLSLCALNAAAAAGHDVPLPQGLQGIPDSAEVARVVRSYHAAEAAGDSATMVALLADDGVILESGGVETKEQFRSQHIAADIAFTRSVQSERSAIRLKTRGDAAWASSTSTAQGTTSGRSINSAGAELMVLVRTPAGWKIAAIHSCGIVAVRARDRATHARLLYSRRQTRGVKSVRFQSVV